MITVYTKEACPQCMATKRFLSKNNLDYFGVSLDGRPDLVERFRAEGFTSVPVVDAGGFGCWSGFRVDQLKMISQNLSLSTKVKDPQRSVLSL